MKTLVLKYRPGTSCWILDNDRPTNVTIQEVILKRLPSGNISRRFRISLKDKPGFTSEKVYEVDELFERLDLALQDD